MASRKVRKKLRKRYHYLNKLESKSFQLDNGGDILLRRRNKKGIWSVIFIDTMKDGILSDMELSNISKEIKQYIRNIKINLLTKN